MYKINRLIVACVMLLMSVVPIHTSVQIVAAASNCLTRYGRNLSGPEWEPLIVGDGGLGTQTPQDMLLLHPSSQYSELLINRFGKRDIMVHALAHTKRYTLPTDPFNYEVTGTFYYQLPHMPQAQYAEYNGETIETHITLYRGKDRKIIILGVQLVINAWHNTGLLQIWDSANNGSWRPLAVIPLDTKWHRVTLKMHPKAHTAKVVWGSYVFNNQYPATTIAPNTWAQDPSLRQAWFALEGISVNPGPGNFGAKHLIRFGGYAWRLRRIGYSCSTPLPQFPLPAQP